MQKGSEFLNILSYKLVVLSKPRFRTNHNHNEVTPRVVIVQSYGVVLVIVIVSSLYYCKVV